MNAKPDTASPEVRSAARLETRRLSFVAGGGLDAVTGRLRAALAEPIPDDDSLIDFKISIDGDLKKGWIILGSHVRERRRHLIEKFGIGTLRHIIGDRWPYRVVVNPGSAFLTNVAKAVQKAEEIAEAHAQRAEVLEAERTEIMRLHWPWLNQHKKFKVWHSRVIHHPLTHRSRRQELEFLETVLKKVRRLLDTTT